MPRKATSAKRIREKRLSRAQKSVQFENGSDSEESHLPLGLLEDEKEDTAAALLTPVQIRRSMRQSEAKTAKHQRDEHESHSNDLIDIPPQVSDEPKSIEDRLASLEGLLSRVLRTPGEIARSQRNSGEIVQKSEGFSNTRGVHANPVLVSSQPQLTGIRVEEP